MFDDPLPDGTRCVVLVEGESDLRAIEAYARRLGRPLEAEGTVVVAMGGITNIGHAIDRYGPPGTDVVLAGLCDVGETRYAVRALQRAGFDVADATLASHGFFICDLDLEAELLRAVGHEEMETFLESEGELGAFRTMQRQPEQRERSLDEQLHRFVGTKGGRKVRYAGALVDHIALDAIPRPLRELLVWLATA